MTCSECGGPAFSDLILAEKKDACYQKVKASAKVWPSAYASGRLVQCRKKGASNYGNKSEGVAEEDMGEGVVDWAKEKYHDYQTGRQWNKFGKAQQKGDAEGMRAAQDAASAHRDKLQVARQNRTGSTLSKDSSMGVGQDVANLKALKAKGLVKEQGVAEDYNPEYDDEAGMADNNLETLQRAVEGIDDLIQSGDNLPEWCQEKIAVAKSMLVAVWDYMYSEEASDEVDPEIDAMFEAMDQLAEEMAAKNNVSADLVWEQFEAMPDNVLYETAAWRRKEGKSAKGGLNAKGVASYRRENPGSKLQTAVTTKPSKLKPGSKAAKRRKSFCARMGGVKGPMKKPNGKPTRKALALRKWNC